MRVIYKYPVRPEPIYIHGDAAQCFINMPDGAEALCVQMQHGQPVLWALVDPTRVPARRRFHILTTGEDIDETKLGRYVGTFQVEHLVFHLFEVR